MIEDKIKKNFPLKELSTFKIGGSAEFFLEIEEKEDLLEAFNWAKKHKKEVSLLGGASNILINDKGINGLVLKLNNTEAISRGDRIECGAGANLNKVLQIAQKNNLTGLEWAVGIPQATIGGATRGNAGAFGENMAEIVETVEVFNIKNGKFKFLSNNDCKFNYRISIFVVEPHYIIWQVTLKMSKASYADISDKIEKNLNFRRNKQPKLPSAGSVFKNLNIKDLEKMNAKMAEHAREQGVVKGGKIGAGWLIDQAGLKGQSVSGAKISLEHANFIVNTGNAKARDVCQLIFLIKQRVLQMFKVKLEEEVQYFGF